MMSVMNPFEVFEPGLAEGRTSRVATIRFLSQGRIHLNAEAGRLLGDATHVQLLFDREDHRIALKPTTADDSKGFKLTRGASQTVLSAAAFQKRYSIPLGPKMRLEADGDLFVAELPSAG